MKKDRQGEKEILKEQIEDCLKYMQALTCGFNEVTDKELAGYYIYEKRAAETRYRYLMEQYRALTQGRI